MNATEAAGITRSKINANPGKTFSRTGWAAWRGWVIMQLLTLLLCFPAPRAGAQTPGDLDTSFLNGMTGPDGYVQSVVLLPDGKLLVGGSFTNINGVARGRVARLHADGSVDATFLENLEGTDGWIWDLAVQSDGKVLIAGAFTKVNGAPLRGIARLNADGSRDTTFLRGLGGASDAVWSVVVQSDGNIVIGGQFASVNGVARPYLARLHADGTLDSSFLDELSGPDYVVTCLALQHDGNVLAGGYFTNCNGVAHSGIARFTANGLLDPAFTGNSGWTNSNVFSLAVRNDDKILAGGYLRAGPNYTYTHLALLNPDGSEDPGFLRGLSGPDSTVLSIHLQEDNKLLVGGFFYKVNGLTQSLLARLNPDGSLDTLFTNNVDRTGSPVPCVQSIVTQTDGKLLIGGWFTNVNGVTRSYLARLWGDAANPAPSINTQPKPLMFTNTAGVEAGFTVWANGAMPRGYQWLLNGAKLTDGERYSGATSNVLTIAPAQLTDAGVYALIITNAFGAVTSAPASLVFKAPAANNLDTNYLDNIGGPNKAVRALVAQRNGAVLIGGEFTSVHGVARPYLARLNPDDSLDTEFLNGLAGPNAAVISMALQSDGKMLVGGTFSKVNGTARAYLARLNSDGSLDSTFLAGLTGPGVSVSAIALQEDGKVLIGGGFTKVSNEVRGRLARLHPDGSLDTTFLDGMAGMGGTVYAIVIQSDGKILVAGSFARVNDVPRSFLARLNADGSLDSTFLVGLAGPSATVSAIALQDDGKVLISGKFTQVNNETRGRLARLHPDGSLDPSYMAGSAGCNGDISSMALQGDGKILIAGSFTEVNGEARGRIARLEGDGLLDASFLDDLAGANDQVSAVAPQDDGKVLVGGNFTAINGVARPHLARLWGGSPPVPPSLITQPISVTCNAGGRATFAVLVAGGAPLSYQWLFNGEPLSPAASLTGTTSNVLTVASAQFGNAGAYSVVVTNAFGCVTSAPAALLLGGTRLNTLQWTEGGHLQMVLHWENAQACELWASTNLADWTFLAAFTNGAGTTNFTEITTNHACRFYRLRQAQ